MPQRAVYHVVPTDQGWSLQREGESYGWRYYLTKRQAIEEGQREAAAHRPGELIIHDEDGRIEESRTFADQAAELAQ